MAFHLLLIDNTIRLSIILLGVLLVRSFKLISKRELITVWMLVFVLGFSPFRFEIPLLPGSQNGDLEKSYIFINEKTDIDLAEYHHYGDASVSEPESDDLLTHTLTEIYILGIGVLLSYQLYRCYLFNKAVSSGSDNQDIIILPGDSGSFVAGFIHPRIFLCEADSHNDLILQHENVHIANHDPLRKLAAFVFLLFYWFNPLAWLSVQCFEEDLEMNCDEAVTRDLSRESKLKYMQMIVDRSVDCDNRSFLRFSGQKNKIKNRLDNLTADRHKHDRKWIVAACILVCIAVSMLFLQGRYQQYRISDKSREESSVLLSLPKSYTFSNISSQLVPTSFTVYDDKNDILVDVMIDYSLTEEDKEMYPIEETVFAEQYLRFEPGLTIEALTKKDRNISDYHTFEEFASSAKSKVFSLNSDTYYYIVGVYEHDYTVWRVTCRTVAENVSRNENVMKSIVGSVCFSNTR